MLFKSKRICTGCEELKPLSEYHRDTKGLQGYARRCKVCKNKRTVSIPIHDVSSDIIKQMDDYCEPCESPVSHLESLTRKYPNHKVLCWNENGATFQTVGDPKIVWKGKTPEEVIEKALRY